MKRVVLCAALIAWSSMASAVVYKWVDAQGKTQYGDRPPDGVKAELVEMAGNRSPSQRVPTAPAPVSGAPAQQANPGAPTDSAGTDAVKKAVAADVAQAREKQCADAQEEYKKLIEGRRLYKTGSDGERQYLTSEEIDAARANAKRDVETTCNSPT